MSYFSVPPDYTVPCGIAQLYNLPDCDELLRIETGHPDTDFVVKLFDKFNNYYVQDLLTDTQGFCFFDTSVYPKGTFSSVSGPIKYQIYDIVDFQQRYPIGIIVYTPPFPDPEIYKIGIFNLVNVF